MQKFTGLFAILILSGCGNQASHLPSPLELPGAVIGTVVENATYGARRQRVKTYVQANYAALRAQARTGQGPALEQAMTIAGVKGNKRRKVKQELQADHARYFPVSGPANVEGVVVTLMVHS